MYSLEVLDPLNRSLQSHIHTQIAAGACSWEACVLEKSMQILCGHVCVISPLPVNTWQVDSKVNVQDGMYHSISCILHSVQAPDHALVTLNAACNDLA